MTLPFFSAAVPVSDPSLGACRAVSRPVAALGWAAACALCLVTAACSPKSDADAATVPPAAGSASGGGGDAVVIVREKRHDHPEKFAAAVREVQAHCIESRSLLAKAQGWRYDPAADQISDAEIAALDTERTEEYFQGKKYAKVVTGSLYRPTQMSPTQDGTCKPVPEPYKTAEVHDGACKVARAEYDYAGKTGRREELKDACDTPESAPEQGGEAVALAGGAQCKWTPAPPALPGGGAVPYVPECTLLPNPVHAGTGRVLVAIRRMPEFLAKSTTPLPGMAALDMQSQVFTEQAVQVSVGGSIAADKFSLPADAAAFPLTQ